MVMGWNGNDYGARMYDNQIGKMLHISMQLMILFL